MKLEYVRVDFVVPFFTQRKVPKEGAKEGVSVAIKTSFDTLLPIPFLWKPPPEGMRRLAFASTEGIFIKRVWPESIVLAIERIWWKRA